MARGRSSDLILRILHRSKVSSIRITLVICFQGIRSICALLESATLSYVRKRSMRAISYPIRRHELYDLIDSGEGPDVEFKRQFSSPEKIAKEIIAFANTRGGYLLFGVDDDNSATSWARRT